MQSVALPCLFFQVKHHIFEREEGERFKDLKDDRSYIRNSGSQKLKYEKNVGLKFIRTHELCLIGAVFYQPSYQAN